MPPRPRPVILSESQEKEIVKETIQEGFKEFIQEQMRLGANFISLEDALVKYRDGLIDELINWIRVSRVNWGDDRAASLEHKKYGPLLKSWRELAALKIVEIDQIVTAIRMPAQPRRGRAISFFLSLRRDRQRPLNSGDSSLNPTPIDTQELRDIFAIIDSDSNSVGNRVRYTNFVIENYCKEFPSISSLDEGLHMPSLLNEQAKKLLLAFVIPSDIVPLLDETVRTDVLVDLRNAFIQLQTAAEQAKLESTVKAYARINKLSRENQTPLMCPITLEKIDLSLIDTDIAKKQRWIVSPHGDTYMKDSLEKALDSPTGRDPLGKLLYSIEACTPLSVVESLAKRWDECLELSENISDARVAGGCSHPGL